MDSGPRGESATSMLEEVAEVEERDLLSRIAARDREAMRDFYLLYHRRLTRFVARIAVRRELIEDIVNEAFVSVWRRAAEFRGDSRVSTWVMGIAWRQGLTCVRRERRRTAYPGLSNLPPAAEGGGPENPNALDRALLTLSPEQRALIELAYVGAYSCEEISAIMRRPANTVRSQLFDARCRLRGELGADVAAAGTGMERATPMEAC